MARKRSKKRSGGGGGRRRMGAAGRGITGEIVPLVLATAGAIGARYVGKVIPGLDPKLQGGITMAAGLFLKMQKNPMLGNLGTGLFIGGGIQLATEMGVLSGIGVVQRPLVLNRFNGRDISGYPGQMTLGASNPVNNFPNPMEVGKARRYMGAHGY